MTKDIICTIGPASNEINTLVSMVEAGMTIMRINTNYCDYEKLREFTDIRNELHKKTGKYIKLLADVRGMQLDVPRNVNERMLKIGEKITIGTDNEKNDLIIINYDNIFNDLSEGTIIKIYEGKIILEVIRSDTEEKFAECKVHKAWKVYEPTGFNVPGVYLHNEILSKYDQNVIENVSSLGYDIVNVGVTKNKIEIDNIKKITSKYNNEIKIFCKIETQFGVKNIDEILENCDGIMLARRDLSVEFDNYELPYLQKYLVNKSLKFKKECIVASQLLSSMTENETPAIADITDLTNAVNQGASAIMTSIETANGKFVIECVKVMKSVIERYNTKKDQELKYEI